jgi:hypothetical protein
LYFATDTSRSGELRKDSSRRSMRALEWWRP